MPLQPGDKLGHYQVISLLGVGGMGEVYRALDTKLKRDVALKVLPATFLRDPERMARFQREAEVLASLNHANIAQIYGIEESNGDRALVMELVPGQTLKGSLPVETALNYARQIADALDTGCDRIPDHCSRQLARDLDGVPGAVVQRRLSVADGVRKRQQSVHSVHLFLGHRPLLPVQLAVAATDRTRSRGVSIRVALARPLLG